jgi:hypothetical protein
VGGQPVQRTRPKNASKPEENEPNRRSPAKTAHRTFLSLEPVDLDDEPPIRATAPARPDRRDLSNAVGRARTGRDASNRRKRPREPGVRDEVLQDLTDDPLQLDWQKRRALGPAPALALLVLLAAAGLAGQYIAYHFDELARQDPTARGSSNCARTRLHGAVRSTSAKSSSNLVVRSHPEFNGALVVDAIIYNRATFSQPFPLLELRFADLNGHLIASRRFKPGEYLSGELEGMAKCRQTPIHIAWTSSIRAPKR